MLATTERGGGGRLFKEPATAFFEGLVDRVWSKVDEENRHRKVFDGLLEAKPIKDPRRRNPFLGD
jgi:hypothetical protein